MKYSSSSSSSYSSSDHYRENKSIYIGVGIVVFLALIGGIVALVTSSKSSPYENENYKEDRKIKKIGNKL